MKFSKPVVILMVTGLAVILAGTAFTVFKILRPHNIKAEKPMVMFIPPLVKETVFGMVLENVTDKDETLTGVSSPAGDVAIKTMSVDPKTNKPVLMDVTSIPLPARTKVKVAPPEFAVVLSNLRKPMKAEESVPVKLTFEHSRPAHIAAGVVQPRMFLERFSPESLKTKIISPNGAPPAAPNPPLAPPAFLSGPAPVTSVPAPAPAPAQ